MLLEDCQTPTQSREHHSVESAVRRRILAEAGLTVRSLVVRRIPDGVCIQGVVCYRESQISLETVLSALPGLSRILDYTTTCEWSDGDDRVCPRDSKTLTRFTDDV